MTPAPGTTRALAAFRDWLVADNIVSGNASNAVTAQPGVTILLPLHTGQKIFWGMEDAHNLGEPEGSINATSSPAMSFRKGFSPNNWRPTSASWKLYRHFHCS